MVGNRVRAAGTVAAVVWTATVWLGAGSAVQQAPGAAAHAARIAPATLFESSDRCFACHNSLITAAGEDVSIGADWRASMMANSARDPYWQASVRREVIDHPEAQAAIEDECSICHMPMVTFPARASGLKGRVFDYLPIDGGTVDALAADGVSCTVCHQLSPIRLGDPSTFTGGYVIDLAQPAAGRPVFGPFAVDPGRTRVMHSSSNFIPAESAHVRQSELCASCHTLFTHALAPGAGADRMLAEQTPYLEWQQSAFRATASCQSCHMPVVEGETAIASVLGQPRVGLSRHSFRGGNFFMQRMLNRFRDELGVQAPAREMDAAVRSTIDHLQRDTARVSIASAERTAGRIELDVAVENLAGHKLPTAYPSRRAWLNVAVLDSTGRVVFESGAFSVDGQIAGNDNDADATKFEPHYLRIDRADQVQVYESMMVDPRGAVTTGLLTGVRFAKDNRLLPRGFSKTAATPETAVHGAAAADADFEGGRDRVRYSIDVAGSQGAMSVVVKLWYQPIGFRWAENLRGYNAPEPQRFVRYYDAMARDSAVVVAETRTTVGPRELPAGATRVQVGLRSRPCPADAYFSCWCSLPRPSAPRQ